MSDILQISAVYGNMEYNKYITPMQPISEGASEVTKLTVINGQLHYDGKPVNTVTAEDALLGFINFLKGIVKPVHAGHNIRTFLYYNMMKLQQWDNFLSVVVGFMDTL